MRSLRCGAAVLALSLPALAGDKPDPKVELGRRLFMDPTVSRAGRFSCSSCHDPERGFSDPRKVSEDENGPTKRHSQPVMDLATSSNPLHWDGEFGSVTELLTARLAPPADAVTLARAIRTREFEAAAAAGRQPDSGEFQKRIATLTPPYYGPSATTTPGSRPVPVPVLVRLEEDNRYAEGFREVYGSSKITTDRLVDALHAYILSLRSGENAYDRFEAGDPSALTASQLRGLALFTGKADCASCHSADAKAGGRAPFTDGAFHNTGVTFRSAVLNFGGGIGLDGGSGEMSFVAEDLGKFKTPSLRDVARRAPYMHDGSFSTLAEVVRYYDRGGTPNQRLDSHVRPLALTDAEVKDLVAFLESLTGAERPGLGPLPEGQRNARIRVLDLRGRPLPGLAVEVRPAGDRLQGGRAAEMPQLLATDRDGYVSFDFPAWTHVRLVSPTVEIHYDWPIPDYVYRMTVMAAPRDKVALKVRAADGGDKLPETLVAKVPGSQEMVATFRRVRRLQDGAAVYAAEKRITPGPFVAVIDGIDGPREFDLSGGWAEPLDLRPG